MDKNEKIKIVAAGVFLIICFIIYWMFFRDISAEDIRSFIADSGVAAPLIYLAAFAVLPILFVPAAVMTPVAGLLFGLWPGYAYAVIGSLISSTVMFLISRYLLGDSLGAWLRRRCPPKWRATFFASHDNKGFGLILILRLFPLLPNNVINYGAGLIGVGFWHYIAATAIGILPGTLIFVNIGDKVLAAGSPQFIIAVVLLIALIATSFILAKLIKPGSRLSAFPALLEQKLMTSRHLVQMDAAENIFFPGCSLMSLDKDIVSGLYQLLQQEIAHLGYCSYCCGKPSRYLATKKTHTASCDKLKALLRQNKVQRIYSGCPSCLAMLREYTDIEVISIWPIVADIMPQPETLLRERYALHDPCVFADDAQTQAAMRQILIKLGVETAEFPHNKEQALCCGNLHMLRQREPEQAKEMLQQRLAEMPKLPIVSYCQTCVNAFKAEEGRESRHIAELMFGKSMGMPAKNRNENRKIKRK